MMTSASWNWPCYKIRRGRQPKRCYSCWAGRFRLAKRRGNHAKRFEILGAVINLPEASGGPIEVMNKESRLQQLTGQVAELKEHFDRTMSRSFIESLKGRLLYAAGHTFGKCTQLACQLLHRVSGNGASVMISAEIVHVVSQALEMLVNAKPRVVERWTSRQSWCLQTELWRTNAPGSPMVLCCWTQ